MTYPLRIDDAFVDILNDFEKAWDMSYRSHPQQKNSGLYEIC